MSINDRVKEQCIQILLHYMLQGCYSRYLTTLYILNSLLQINSDLFKLYSASALATIWQQFQYTTYHSR